MEDMKINIITNEEKEKCIKEYKQANKSSVTGAIATTVIIPTVLSGLLMASWPTMTQFDIAQSWCAFAAFTAGLVIPYAGIRYITEVNEDKQDTYHKGYEYNKQKKLAKKRQLKAKKPLKQCENCK